jgi:GNAT superfamily N-acetyltransferase
VSDWVSASIGPHHDLDSFDCGVPSLNDWLTQQARRADGAGTARTVVWTSGDGHRVVAYFALAPTQVARRELPSSSLAGGYSTIPGYLIARLALARELHGQGLGTQLLLDAIGRIMRAARLSGGRLVVVDAVDEAAHGFYRRHDFVPVDGTMRLFMKVATAEKALGQPEPGVGPP